MAFNRAQAGGLSYLLPENRYINQQPIAPSTPEGAVPFFNLPQENDDLAIVEGLTDKYINTKAEIERFALDMATKYGVDVTAPDHSQQDGGGAPFKTFQKLATSLLVTANDLKQRRENQKQLLPQLAAGNIRTIQSGDLTAQKPETQFYNTDLLPEVKQANDILKTAVYTDEDHDRFKQQVFDPIVADLTARMNEEGVSPMEKEYLQYNINALVQAPRTTPYATFQNAGKSKSTVEIDLLKKVTNVSQGKWPKGSYDTATDEKGNPVLVNKFLDGAQAGEYVYEDAKGAQKRVPKIVDGFVKKADGVYFSFKQTDGVSIPPVKVSSRRGDEIAQDIIASNPKYGSVTKMYEAMRNMGLADEDGSLVNEKILAGEDFDTPDPSIFGERIAAEKERIKKRLKEGTANDPAANLFVNRPKIDLILPSGETATLVKHRVGDGWFLEGQDDNDDFTHMTWNDVESWLAQEKYFDQFLNKPEKEEAAPSPQPVGTKSPSPSASIPSLKSQIVPPGLGQPQAAPPDATTAAPVPKFKVTGESGTEGMHPWAIVVGNLLTDSLGGEAEFNSVRRTPENNKKVGGKDNSFHLIGAGLDIKPSDWKKVSDTIKKKLVTELGAQIIDEGDHIHIEPKSKDVLSDTTKLRAAELIAKYSK